MFGIPVETLSVLGGSVVGFYFRYLAERAKERQQLFENLIAKTKQNEESANAAVERVSIEQGKWVRRFIVFSGMFAVVYATFMLAFFDIPTVVTVEGTRPEWLFGLLGGGDFTKFVEVNGFFMTPEVRVSILTMIGFYFGNAVAKK